MNTGTPDDRATPGPDPHDTVSAPGGGAPAAEFVDTPGDAVAPAMEAAGPAAARVDKWAHRRAEPRPLALLWTTFLAVTSGLTLAALVSQGAIGHDVYRPAARGLFAIVGVGLVVLWPMLRLSQEPPREPVGGAVWKDMVVMLAPAQAVLWPQAMIFLANWPLSVVGACAALLGAWTLLVGAVLATALAHVGAVEGERDGRTAGGVRGAWMVVFVMLAGLGPLAGILVGPSASSPGATSDISISAMTSPITGVLEITSDRAWSGRAAVALPAHWSVVGVTLGGAMCAWVAWALVRRRWQSGTIAGPAGPGEPIGIQTGEKNPLHGADASVSGPGSPEATGVSPPHGS